jgi:hypothetical protein
MLMDEELLRGIEQYGRWNVQEFVARSQEMVDVLAYLRAERAFRMFKVVSFITVDLIHFSKRTNLSLISDESEGEANTGSKRSKEKGPTDFTICSEEG